MTDTVVKKNRTAGMSKTRNEISTILLNDRGDAYIAGTNMKVRYIVLETFHLKRDVEAIIAEHDNLSRKQVQDALAYYTLHKLKIDAEIREEDEYIERSRHASRYQPSIKELKSRIREA